MKASATTQNVSQAYAALVLAGTIEDDPAQKALVTRLDLLLADLAGLRQSQKSSALGWLFNQGRKAREGPQGLYLHGGVGRGKSMLMDLLFELAPVPQKRRVHFNDFMVDAHERIARQRNEFAAGKTREADPIRPVGRALAQEAKLLCFDEFSISDIADAMIIGRLFAVMFQQGTIVVATSNVAPDGLYNDGLNRQLFLPFIAMLKAHCEVYALDARADFRLEKIESGEAYLSPLGPRADAMLQRLWDRVSSGLESQPVELGMKGRKLIPKRAARRVAWFKFDQLCCEPRAAGDYLAIAKRFDTVVIEAVPMMGNEMRNEAKRFVTLVDILYDKGVRTVFSAEANPHALYQGTSGAVAIEFQRTASRLVEMQSKDYLERFKTINKQG